MRKGIYFILVIQIILLLWVMSIASPAFAFTIRATAAHTNLAYATMTLPERHRPRRYFGGGTQENNQSIRAIANNTANRYYRGHDQGNSGNYGYNRGYSEDNSSNETNQIINRSGIIRHTRNNQNYQIITNNSFNLHYFGYRQGNSGNNGYNEGYNRDNSLNGGNQIIN